MTTLDDYLDTKAAGEILKIRAVNVARIAARGGFPGARKAGRDWLIPKTAVEAYAASPPKPGPKRKTTK